ncbi:Hypothetical predicted protein, partial [Pelobates cultripes]
IKKERSRKIDTLTAAIHVAETEHKQDPTSDNFQTLTALRIELRSLLAVKAYRSVQLTRSTFYAQGNKSGKLLAKALKTKQQRSFIDKVTDGTGKACNTTDDIAKAFNAFYSNLYNLAPPNGQLHNLREYVAAQLPRTIPAADSHTLDEPFTQ